MKRVALLGTALLVWWGCTSNDLGGTKPPDYLIMAFSAGEATVGLPRTSLLEDRTNQSIVRACSHGANLGKLAALGVDSLERRVGQMCEGRVLKCDDSVFYPALPFFVDAGRAGLDSIADGYAGRLADSVEALIDDIRSSRLVKPGECFHLLWSLVMDECWYSIWQRIRPTEAGPPQVIWIVDPPHAYAVGTNYWQLPGGSIAAATWSPHSQSHLESLSPLRLALLRAAWQMPVKDSVAEVLLRQYGFLDDREAYLGLAYGDSTSFASRLDEWRVRYSEAVARCLDLQTASAALRLPEGQTFVILLHEIAYALFKRLADSRDLEFPPVLVTGNPVDRTVDLVSVRLVRRPLPEDEVMALLMANDYHGTAELVGLIRGILTTDPDNVDMRLFLGMSLFDLKRYDEAVVAFQELSARTAGDVNAKRLFDWSRLWLGHIYDAKGERNEALKWYRAVESDGSRESIMSFGQYQIGSVDAVTWAGKRITDPFRWPR